MILRDTYEQAGAPDPVLAPAVVLELARRHAPGAREVVAVDEAGGEARTYMIAADDRDLVLKTQRPHRRRRRTSLEKEALFLRHLAAVPGEPLPVPRVLGHGSVPVPAGSGDAAMVEIEYTLMTRIPGDSVARAGVVGDARRAVLLALGGVLRRIHAAPQDPLLKSGLFPGDTAPSDVAVRLEAPALAAAQKLGGSALARLLPERPVALVRRAVAALPAGGERVALHANPGPVHTFVEPATGAFTGLIDFGDAYVSHPALDLRRWDRHEDRVALLEGYRREGAVDADFLRVWRVACLLAELAALAAAPGSAAGTDAEGRAAVIRSLLEELEEHD